MTETNEPRRTAVVVNDTRVQRHYGCEAVMTTIATMLERQGIDVIRYQAVNRPWNEDDAFLESAAAADIVIVNGEGSIHHANAKAQTLSSLGTVCKTQLRKPSILLNATLFANDEAVYRGVADFDAVVVRDRASIAEAAGFGVTDVGYCPDFSMFHDFGGLRTVTAPSTPPKVGFTDSVVTSARDLLQEIAEKRGFSDASIRFAKGQGKGIRHYAEVLGGLDLLVTGRFHSVCFALATRTPFIAVESNTPKITNVLNDILGSADRVVAAKTLKKLDLVPYVTWTEAENQALDRFFAAKADLYGAVERRIGELAATASALSPS
ncbi:polysaccharide pyruvyl transferase family protein [Methylobrevis albus]|uniref:Polysaccharide pyruvyl transferase family protein n=1 Tax=Methylobrevis albus TaxID=2793297 RepID=A0A931N006_9HYPH|nr:polysaccharide pyruvyl transferase family protein [Methylobrevis albus]MBH0239575.1 polysaccharide pyruvyl transferase family protein [Methylobrevis albus]